MKENTFSERAILGFSIALVILVIGAFSWLWFGAKKPSPEQYMSSNDLKEISVSALESEAKTLLDGLQNHSGIPVAEPTSKEGKEDPFAEIK